MRLVISVNLRDFLLAEDGALFVTIALHCRYIASLPGLINFLVQLDQAIDLGLIHSSCHVRLAGMLGELC
jgi:hypothetical protein